MDTRQIPHKIGNLTKRDFINNMFHNYEVENNISIN